MTNNERLLMPRYLVIADYPGSLYKIGYIIHEADNLEGATFFKTEVYKYPHLFRPLQWWEHRKPEEMPKYVKDVFRPGMVNDICAYKIKSHYTQDFTPIDGKVISNKKMWVDENGFSHLYIHYVPATLEEYTEYQSHTKIM